MVNYKYTDYTSNLIKILKTLKNNRHKLKERAKELACLYTLLRAGISSKGSDQFLGEAVKIIPLAWQYPKAAGAKITYRGKEFFSDNFASSIWVQVSDMRIGHIRVGNITVCYREHKTEEDEGPFLKEERKLLEASASIISVILKQKEDEQKLEESEKRYRQFVENFNGINFLVDFDLKPEFLHGKVKKITGYSQREFKERKISWTDIVHPEDVNILIKGIGKLKEIPGSVHESDLRVIRKGGNEVWVRAIIQGMTDPRGQPQKIKGILIDISREKKYEEKIEHLNSVLLAIRNINQLIVVEKDAQKLIEKTCFFLMETRGYKNSWALLFDSELKLKMGCSQGIGPKFDEFLNRVSKGEIPYCVKRVFEKKEIITISDKQKKCSCCVLDVKNNFKQVIVPLMSHSKFYGVISISYIKSLKLESDELGLLKEVGGDISFALHNIELGQDKKNMMDKLKKSNKETRAALDGLIRTLSSIVETKDPYTHTHQVEVSRLAKMIARKLKLPHEEVEAIERASLIHDIGKITIPSDILSKPGKLSDIEFNMLKTHPKISYNMIQGINFKKPIAAYVLQHHERLDGSGYPCSLKGEEIMLGAKIIAVADVVEAISSHRPYRPAKSMDEAEEEIRNNRGILYEPEVVDACLDILSKNKWR